MTELSVVLATYNEEENIGIMIDKVQENIKGIDSEIIVVDDDSKDKTAEVAEEANKKYGNIRVIVRKDERGLATALLRGYEESKGKYILNMDADLAHDPQHIPYMISLLRNNEADFVIGSRYVKGSKVIGKPFSKAFASWVGQFAALVWLGLKVKDTSNNFRMFPKSLYEEVKDRLHPDGANVMIMEFAYRVANKGYRIKEFPTLYRERTRGVTKLKLGKEVTRFVKNIWRMKFR